LFSQSADLSAIHTPGPDRKTKARESLEAVYSARNDATIGFAGIQNVSNGGIFLDGFQPLFLAGANGIVGTQGQSGVLDRQILPGPDGILGTADDEIIPLINFQRQILITPLIDSTGNVGPEHPPNQRDRAVTSPGRAACNYTVTGYISRFQ
jgi:hypothetical protein